MFHTSGAHSVFITSRADYTGDFKSLQAPAGGHKTGLAGADHQCQTLAMDLDLPILEGTFWRALLSDNFTSAKSRLDIKSAVYNFNGEIIKTVDPDYEGEFWTALPNNNNRINRDESNVPVNYNDSNNSVWTGTGANGIGVYPYFCDNWSNATTSFFGAYGIADEYTASWNYSNYQACNSEKRLYCINQVLPGLNDFYVVEHPSEPENTKITFTLPIEYKHKELKIHIFRSQAANEPFDSCDISDPDVTDLDLASFFPNNEIDDNPSLTNIDIDDDVNSLTGSYNYRVCIFNSTGRLLTTSHYFGVSPNPGPDP